MPNVDITDFPYRPDAEALFAAIRDFDDPIWMDSGKPRSLSGRFDIISAQPTTILETVGKITQITTSQAISESSEDPFALAQQLLDTLGTVDHGLSQYPFLGGLAGYFGYDLGHRIEVLPNLLGKVDSLPDLRLGLYNWALVLNHSSRKAWLIFRNDCPGDLRETVTKRLKQADNRESLPGSDGEGTNPFEPSMSRDAYLNAVSHIKEYISEGDCYQVNLARHFSAKYQGDSWHLYRALRRILPSPYSCYYQFGKRNQAVLSFSPERFLKLSAGQVETKPIKGTARRGRTVEEDQQNAIELMNSTKNRAENLMIVDLLRNDLGKTCQPGSIRVPKLFALESFPNVHHLVSTVTGKLREDESPLSLLRGCFPGGSITGAPKKRAMEIIETLETCRRSVYCGSIGYISSTGRMDTNIAIRTILADGDKLHCWGGGGIVADSNAESEFQEILDKIRVLIEPDSPTG
ncbi:MAG: aminodeoxychorismate synthase, component I [Porticoccus sp.]|jgi:para-aminobenzoate synthetase component 1|uniref:aminodeoxychorismate synthase component I n=1 Tax=Porticoccus hydrocarbonoclasticus TaxID=1073414 RepID=UPI00055ED99E|nr:aminodeoxychorismate synthase component I [Porticoccus hydrocarbonoclasticus]MBG58324.1 aminodeoxychorismate synthase, component I [Porticoccus sp.]|tara:strand:+ start:2089 stop:3477 length:1389 start_codon:yes stop_codon:yes gene_type:complete